MGTVTEDIFGQTEHGEPVKRYTLQNANGVVVRVLNYGAIIKDIIVPDRNGVMADINLGFDDMKGYNKNTPYIGAVIGRFTNRIAGAKFSLDGQIFKLAANEEPNFIHGGCKGFDKMVWSSHIEGRKVFLQYVSPDGEEGFPGEVTTQLTYELTDDNQLILRYEAKTTKATPINLTNHAYFNLGGHDLGTVDDHIVVIHADTYAVLDDKYLPTGELRTVERSVYDLRTPVRLGDCMMSVPGGNGYTTSFDLNHEGKLELVSRIFHPGTGRSLECYTTEPSVMFYTSCNLDVDKAKGGATYRKYGAFCLEAQHHPDTVNQSSFPSCVLRPEDVYTQTTIYKFGVEK